MMSKVQTDAEFWDGMEREERREFIQEALRGQTVASDILQAVSGNQWHRIPERLSVNGVYIKDALRPLLAPTRKELEEAAAANP